MDISRYKTVTDWFQAARGEGYQFPLAVCNALSETMRELKLSFQDAYKILMDKEKLILDEEHKFYIVDFSYRTLWERKHKLPMK